MKREKIEIGHIPALIWGDPSNSLIIAVHGDKSSKADDAIALLAKVAAGKGYGVISFDLPEHGGRTGGPEPLRPWVCSDELRSVLDFARTKAGDISLFACSLGAYFSLLAYAGKPLRQALFLSPVVDMRRLMDNMMGWFGVTSEELEQRGEICTPIGKTLYWDYYAYVRAHPAERWNIPTAVLYGSRDETSERDIIEGFCSRFNCGLTVMEDGRHYFHTDDQMKFLGNWLEKTLI